MGIPKERFTTYLEFPHKGFPEPFASAAQDDLVGAPGLVGADDRDIGALAALEKASDVN